MAVPVIKTGYMMEQMVTYDKNGSHMRCERSSLEVVMQRLPGRSWLSLHSGQAPGEILSTQQTVSGE